MKLGAYISREEMKEVCGGSSVSYTLSVKMPRKIWRGMMWKVFLADCSSSDLLPGLKKAQGYSVPF